MKSIMETIGFVPLFQGLDRENLEEIALVCERRTVKKGELIFTDGDPCNGFYVVETGKVKIFKLSFGGKEQILHIYGPGKPFGEVPVFTGKQFPASALAVANSTLIFFPRKRFVELIITHPSLALNMLAVLSMRLKEFTVMVENLALKEVPARLASYLMATRKEQEQQGPVRLPVSKTQLAGLLGTTPETISRILARMTHDGLIQVDNRVITILDPDGVTDLAEQG
jgi:CRP/FNR family transcriptional regulator